MADQPRAADHRSLLPCWVCGETPTTVLIGRLPTCADHLHNDQPEQYPLDQSPPWINRHRYE